MRFKMRWDTLWNNRHFVFAHETEMRNVCIYCGDIKNSWCEVNEFSRIVKFIRHLVKYGKI